MSKEKQEFAIITPVSLNIEREKTIVSVDIQGTSEEAIQKAREAYGNLINADSSEKGNSDIGNSNSFGFNSRKWNGSNWEPKGPRNNPVLS